MSRAGSVEDPDEDAACPALFLRVGTDVGDKPLPRWLRSIFAVYWAVFLGLILLALLRREAALLLWIPALVLLDTFVTIRREVRRYRWKARRRRLRRRVPGPLVNGKGREGWLTHQGLFLSDGRLYPWKEFAGYRLEPGVCWITLLSRKGFIHPSKRDSLERLGGYVVVCLVVAALLWVYVPRFGLRPDVLALLWVLAGYLIPFAIVGLVLWKYRSGLWRKAPMALTGLVNAEVVPPEKVRNLLDRHLPVVEASGDVE